DSVIRSVWAIKGSKPRVKITGSHKKTFIFGSLSLDGRQLFRQYSQMNTKIFLNYLKSLKRKFKKFIFFYDGAPWHRTKEIIDFFEENRDCIIPIRFPKCSPEFSPLEECWRQGRNDIIGPIVPHTFDELKRNISKYYRTKRFKLDMIKYLCQ
ncbi:MAG: transposase, partial [Halobacteriota archaeon]|nr:transposase [Halobacteriota archaeon]